VGAPGYPRRMSNFFGGGDISGLIVNCIENIISGVRQLFGRWQQRCGHSLSVLRQPVITAVWWLCCRRAGRREGQVPPGHCRARLHLHRTHRLLISLRLRPYAVHSQSLCSSGAALSTSPAGSSHTLTAISTRG